MLYHASIISRYSRWHYFVGQVNQRFHPALSCFWSIESTRSFMIELSSHSLNALERSAGLQPGSSTSSFINDTTNGLIFFSSCPYHNVSPTIVVNISIAKM